LGNGVVWIWDLKEAEKTILTDAAREARTGEGLNVAQSVCNNDFQGKLGFCQTTNKVIPVLADGRPMYPTDPMLICPPASLITDPAKVPPPSLNNAAASFQQVQLRELSDCADNRKNPSLSRDCLLQAIKNNGCSPNGTLYTALQTADPQAAKWDSQLKAQASFQAYQSKQGNNAFTEKLFERGMADWNTAVREVSRLQNVSQSAADPYVRVAARDLCTSRGSFDVYDFCAEIPESAAIGTVDLKCLQRLWQQENGKPAGMAYPNTNQLSPELGTVNTYGDYKAAVRRLKSLTTTSDPVAQRRAVNNFLGVRVGTISFDVKNVLGTEPDQSAPCFGIGYASPDRSIRLYTKEDCDILGGRRFASGECLKQGVGSYSWDCRYLNMEPDSPLQFWVDVMDASTLTIDGKNGVRRITDKSGRNRHLVQNTSYLRPVYTRSGAYGGIEFSGIDQFLDIPNAYTMVRSQFTIFVVERRKSAKTENYFLGGTTLSRNRNLVLGYANDRTGLMAFWANDTATSVPAYRGTTESTRLWCFKKPAGAREITVDGGTPVAPNPNSDSLQEWQGAALGRYFDKFYQGVLYEVLIYSAALSLENQRKVEGYLAHKWALATNLPNNHPFKAGPP
jgi:hypothetical protein